MVKIAIPLRIYCSNPDCTSFVDGETYVSHVDIEDSFDADSKERSLQVKFEASAPNPEDEGAVGAVVTLEVPVPSDLETGKNLNGKVTSVFCPLCAKSLN